MEQVEAVSHYKTNLRDIEFNLFEVLGRDEVLGTGPFGEIDGESAREILREVERLSREDLAASYEDSDRNPPVFDPATHTAPVPESFKASYQAWMDSEFWRLQVLEEMGGTPAPSSLVWAIGEMVLGANAPVWMYAAGPAFAGVVHRNGNERDKQVAQLHGRPPVGLHHGADRARRGLRRRRRPHQGHPQRGRLVEHHGRQALHHQRRGTT